MKPTRRNFVKTTGLVGIGALSAGSTLFANGKIIGANDHIRFAVIGLNGRGGALLDSILTVANTSVTHLCDVDTRAIAKGQKKLIDKGLPRATEVKDFRKLLDNKDIDALAIASPDHWHAPMAIMGAKAGKYIYVEKPCCHNPAEGELLLKVRDKYNAIIQMGNQQRSGLATLEAIGDIRDGILGTPYMGKAWYSNKRGSIGVGKKSAVPEWLDWDLFQGPAPRREFKDNIVHYNWHWFRNWGTGEINNNGTHEIDICRYALGVKYPKRVTSSGGRYQFNDDWEFYDTQVANFEFEEGKMITWEGRSCNPKNMYDRGRGVMIFGTKGSALMDREGYTVWNNDGEQIKYVKEIGINGTLDLTGGGTLTDRHMENFGNAIRKGESLNADIRSGYVSNLLPHLGNIAQENGGSLTIDPSNGHILNNAKALNMWSREYENGWAPTL